MIGRSGSSAASVVAASQRGSGVIAAADGPARDRAPGAAHELATDPPSQVIVSPTV